MSFENSQHQRIIAAIFYMIAFWLAHHLFIEPMRLIPGPDKGLWFYNGIASLLFGTRLLNPYFTPPADAAANGFVGLTTFLLVLVSPSVNPDDLWLLYAGVVYGALVTTGAVAVILFQASEDTSLASWHLLARKTIEWLGSPKIIFSFLTLAAVWVFHRNAPVEVFVILSVIIITFLRPIEFFMWLWKTVKASLGHKLPLTLIGKIVAYQKPDLVLIRERVSQKTPKGTCLLIADKKDNNLIGIAIDYVGRDEGHLLRVITLPVPQELKKVVDDNKGLTDDMSAYQLAVEPASLLAISTSSPECPLVIFKQICGIVDQDTTLDTLLFEIVDDAGLEEGCLVHANIGEKPVLYQVMDGVTREEVVQQKSKRGYARGQARKIGRWDTASRKFVPVNWLPNINSPVYLKEREQDNQFNGQVGKFPGTTYGVNISISDAVTHNTAILGILGIGKTCLSLELIERMLADNIKVICVDLTNQYAVELAAFFDAEAQGALDDALARLGPVGKTVYNNNPDLGGSTRQFRAKLKEQLEVFLTAPDRRLRIFNPAQFEVWQQTSKMFSGSAAMAQMTPCEITALLSEVVLEIVQGMGMADTARICIVYEEAHSLIPEWNAVAAEGDKSATSRTAKAILQGRKFGLGCLVITQRTANVTKTILNQCNTIFAMRTFDDTGKEFLSNYIGRGYTNVLSSLHARHAVFFGKASSCENPVLIRLNDRDEFTDGFRVP